MSGGERFASCCVSFGIGLLQLLTTVLCFIGWIWSCVWGGFFIVSSGTEDPRYNDSVCYQIFCCKIKFTVINLIWARLKYNGYF